MIMEKILINVYVPIIEDSYDMFIPQHLKIFEVLELVKKAIAELSDGRFIPNDDNIIALRKDGEILNINMSVYELGICNGSQLMLI